MKNNKFFQKQNFLDTFNPSAPSISGRFAPILAPFLFFHGLLADLKFQQQREQLINIQVECVNYEGNFAWILG